ncbi:uncharacterized protein ASCRUDRAFT_74328 [Ascoidea rubescens DSM 1968]|uniref:Uncharacterized protein n=1 Tax=Ascoidea rubescens DSM 1968 TaxID=1344418 RepID=A0A1D2VMR2_9ASCO|nr:hypothetical protein ASCRUDRAFT_74328 [Ascoidea rubescens DSM 1968]ODV62874.1 hypothetical protein ASCRUDRAFT_74328 [Ascoidea rubescens DSM 1968]
MRVSPVLPVLRLLPSLCQTFPTPLCQRCVSTSQSHSALTFRISIVQLTSFVSILFDCFLSFLFVFICLYRCYLFHPIPSVSFAIYSASTTGCLPQFLSLTG